MKLIKVVDDVVPFATNVIVKVPSSKVATSIKEKVFVPFKAAIVVVFTTTPAWFVIEIVAVVALSVEKVASKAGLPAAITLIPSKFVALAVAKINIATIEVNKAFIFLVLLLVFLTVCSNFSIKRSKRIFYCVVVVFFLLYFFIFEDLVMINILTN